MPESATWSSAVADDDFTRVQGHGRSNRRATSASKKTFPTLAVLSTRCGVCSHNTWPVLRSVTRADQVAEPVSQDDAPTK